MGKYLIKVECMDMNEKMSERFEQGFELDGFCIFGKDGDNCSVAIHEMNVDGMSDVIKSSDNLMMAAILAKAKKEVCEIGGRNMAKGSIARLLGLE